MEMVEQPSFDAIPIVNWHDVNLPTHIL